MITSYVLGSFKLFLYFRLANSVTVYTYWSWKLVEGISYSYDSRVSYGEFPLCVVGLALR